MIKNISNWLFNISKTRAMLLTLGIMILFMAIVLPGQAARSESEVGSSSSPDTTFFYSPRELLQMAEEYGEVGRRAYIQSRWTFDLVFPLVYVSFLAVGISWLFRTLDALPPRWIPLNILPIVSGLFDYLENSGTSLVMGIYPAQVPALPLVTAILSGIKWILVGGSFLVYLLLAGWVLFQRVGKILGSKG